MMRATELNADLRSILKAPMTPESHPEASRVALAFQCKQGLIVPDPIRTLDRRRLVKRLYALRPQTLALTLQTLQAMLAP